MICWQPYTPIYTVSTFFKNFYIKILISLQPCPISYNLSRGDLRRSKYCSGVFSINIPDSDSLASVLTANLTCNLPMGLIEQGIVSNSQSNSPITYLFIYSNLPAFFFNNKIFSFFRVLCCSLLICATGKIEVANPVSNLNKWLILGVELDEFFYLFIHLFIYTNTKQFGFSLFIEKVMSLLKKSWLLNVIAITRNSLLS